jgi:hypothetical protein
MSGVCSCLLMNGALLPLLPPLAPLQIWVKRRRTGWNPSQERQAPLLLLPPPPLPCLLPPQRQPTRPQGPLSSQ